MNRLSLLLLLAVTSSLFAGDTEPLRSPAHRLSPDDPAWTDLAAALAQRPDTIAPFTEKRFFSFRKTPLMLRGDSRVSAAHGLSLHYTAPEESITVFDERGLLVRAHGRDTAAPADPRATAANAALVQVLRFDLRALAANFEIFGQRDGPAWTLALVPRAAELRRAVAEIVVTGEAADLRQITIRRSPKQYVEIAVDPPTTIPFTAADLKRFFR